MPVAGLIICLATAQSCLFTTATFGLIATESCLEAGIIGQRLSFWMYADVYSFYFRYRLICLTQHHLLLFVVGLEIDSNFATLSFSMITFSKAQESFAYGMCKRSSKFAPIRVSGEFGDFVIDYWPFLDTQVVAGSFLPGKAT